MPSDLIETRLSEISERIRQGRESQHLTLTELGQRSGVAPSTIQKIENRQMTPSIVVILKIAAGLGLEGRDLIAPPEPSPLHILLQRTGQHATIAVSKEMKFEKLSAEIVGSELECWRLVIAAGHEVKFSVPQGLHELVMFCERGQVEMEFARQQVYFLSVGDTLHCRSQVIHRIANHGNIEAALTMSGRFYTSAHAAFTAEFNGRSSRTRATQAKPSIQRQRVRKKARPEIASPAEVVVEEEPRNIRIAKGGLRDCER